MASEESRTCAHPPCTCAVTPPKEYCSEPCEDAGKDEVEIACDCKHATCATTD